MSLVHDTRILWRTKMIQKRRGLHGSCLFERTPEREKYASQSAEERKKSVSGAKDEDCQLITDSRR